MPHATLVTEPHGAASGIVIAVHGFTRRPADLEGGSPAVYRWGCGDSSGPAVKAAVVSRTLTFVDEVLLSGG